MSHTAATKRLASDAGSVARRSFWRNLRSRIKWEIQKAEELWEDEILVRPVRDERMGNPREQRTGILFIATS